jgi:hypothetical protein
MGLPTPEAKKIFNPLSKESTLNAITKEKKSLCKQITPALDTSY